MGGWILYIHLKEENIYMIMKIIVIILKCIKKHNNNVIIIIISKFSMILTVS